MLSRFCKPLARAYVTIMEEFCDCVLNNRQATPMFMTVQSLLVLPLSARVIFKMAAHGELIK